MCETAMQTIFRLVIIAKLTYAAINWRGFTKASERQRMMLSFASPVCICPCLKNTVHYL